MAAVRSEMLNWVIRVAFDRVQLTSGLTPQADTIARPCPWPASGWTGSGDANAALPSFPGFAKHFAMGWRGEAQ